MSFVEMDTTVAEGVFDALETAGATLETDWTRARQAVSAGEAGIGDDEIARAFRTHYDPARDLALRSADNAPRMFTALVVNGRAIAADYLAADARGAAEVRRGLPPIQGPR
ncbi:MULTISPECIES: hypothetical protein [Saccharothrix]|uniref:hypothetical protein n=1 Tax=Saccharothrix TaxID=2071 RepID=UPI00093A2442|nr:hypothetical protein [Saccharothrix sp. CB00851]OKI22753.1 hypothetical protein A6A25_35480 [Saccharothrix sp. CB00851]